MSLPSSRNVLLAIAISDAALSLAVSRERALIASTIARVAVASVVAVCARSPGRGLHAIIAVAMVRIDAALS